MTGRIPKLGSSPAGLLSATAVFVGLLVYASYFAFEKSTEDSADAGTQVTTSSQTVGSIVSPLSSGIFSSETLQVEELDRAFTPNQTMPSDVTETISAMATPDTQKSLKDLRNQSNQSEISKIQRLTPDLPDNVNGDRMSSTNTQQLQTGLANQHYYQAFADGRTRARGRERMNADGEFNFTLNFKSRARMNTERDVDTRLSANLSGHNEAYYRNWNSIHPAYQYYYQNY